MTKVADTPFWDEKNDAMGSWTPADDLLHPKVREVEPGAALTETHYFGFNIPEHRISGMGWLWHHPNLRVATHGSWAWQGVKRHPLQCELFDWIHFESDKHLDNDLMHYRFPNSYEVTTYEPMKQHRIQYQDEKRQNAFDIEYEAVMPPAMMKNGHHFEQGMRTRGEVTLRGKSYAVDGYTVRDRSWAHLRAETLLSGPPTTWMTAAFDDDFLFTISAVDSPSLAPALGKWSGITDEQAFRHGWVRTGGETRPVVSCRKLTRRDKDSLFPQSAYLEFVDADGRKYVAEGRLLAVSTLAVWPNIDCSFGLIEWTCEGKTGHGDFQDLWPPDFIREFFGKSTI